MKRTITLIIALSLILSAMLGIAPLAEEETPELEVAYAGIEFGNAVYLYFAVDYTAFGSSEGITLRVTNTVSGKVVELSPASKILAPTGCIAFRNSNMGSTNMGDEFIVQALKDGEESGEAKRYSVLEYALKVQGGEDQTYTDLMKAMIKYGSGQQKLSGNLGTYDLTKEWSLVTAKGATVEKSIVLRDSEVTLTPTVEGQLLFTSRLERVTGAVVASEPFMPHVFVSEDDLVDFSFDLAAGERALPAGWLSEGSATFTFSIKKVEDKALPSGPVLKAAEDGIRLFVISDGAVCLSEELKGLPLGEPSTEEKLLFHVVYDASAKTLTGYTATGRGVAVGTTSLTGDSLSSFVWEISEDAGLELSKLSLTKGNIFE